MQQRKTEMSEEKIIIREMEKTDLPQVLAMEKEYFPEAWSESIYVDALDLPYYTFLVAADRESGKIAGYGTLMNVADEGDIMNLAVRKDFRRHGLGELLLRRLMERGKEKGAVDFSLEVRSSNEAAVPLYRKMGFAVEGVRRGYYESTGEDALIMWKRGPHMKQETGRN